MARARQARSVETRARLVDAAAAVIASHGIDGASVDAIADAAERTSGSLYGQFGSKDGLIVALLDESKDVVAARMSGELAEAVTLDERLEVLWRNFADPPGEARHWVRFEHELWAWATRDRNGAARTRLSRRYRHEFAPLAEVLAAWTDEGLIDPPLPPDRMAVAVVAALLGLEMSHRLDARLVDGDDVVAVLRSLLGAPAAEPRPSAE